MDVRLNPWLHKLALPASAVLIFGSLVWIGLPGTELRGQIVATGQASNLPPAVYVLADPNPTTSILGTEASISPETLRLQLFATSPGVTPLEGTAVIGTHANNPQTYAAGSVLASGATVEEIHADHVELSMHGRRVRLYRVGARQTDDEMLTDATTVGGPGMADRLVDRQISSRADPTDFIRPRLFFDGDKVAGFVLGDDRGAHRLAEFELEAGDIIRSIDGRPITSDADWQRLTTPLSRGSAVVLGIDRKDESMSIVLDGAHRARPEGMDREPAKSS